MSAIPAESDSPRDLLPSAVLRPVREGNALDTTVGHLKTAIRLGVFVHGERLPPERELADRLGVGRATLREAIGALREAGLVTTTRGRTGGTMVIYRGPEPSVRIDTADGAPALDGAGAGLDWDRDEVADVLAFRRVVEPGAVELAARADLSRERRSWLATALEEVIAQDGPQARRVADARLHLAVTSMSGSPLLLEAVTHAYAKLTHLLAELEPGRTHRDRSDAQHTEIVAAVLAGDAARARRAMEEHCDATESLMRGLLG